MRIAEEFRNGAIWHGRGDAAETERIRVIAYESADSVIVERAASRFAEAHLGVPLRVSEAQLRIAFQPPQQ